MCCAVSRVGTYSGFYQVFFLGEKCEEANTKLIKIIKFSTPSACGGIAMATCGGTWLLVVVHGYQ